MKALQQLQKSAVFQAAGDREAHQAMSVRTKAMITMGVGIALAIAASAASAQQYYGQPYGVQQIDPQQRYEQQRAEQDQRYQQQRYEEQRRAWDRMDPTQPSLCVPGVAAITGAMVSKHAGNSQTSRIIGAIAGAAGGAALGRVVCPEPVAPQPVYSRQVQPQMGAHGQVYGVAHPQQAPQVIYQQQNRLMSYDEVASLDGKVQSVMAARMGWEEKAGALDVARTTKDAGALPGATQAELEARRQFVAERTSLAATTHRMETSGVNRRDMEPYLRITAAFNEIPTNGTVTYKQLTDRDDYMRRANPTYNLAMDMTVNGGSLAPRSTMR